MSVSVRIDGLMILTGVAVVAVGAAWVNRGRLLDKINPASDQNIVYQGMGGIGDAVGIPNTDSRGVSLDDYFFAAIDQVNPFNDSDAYSDYVIWGKEIAP
ncbi:hypothetical protein [Microbulbifer sp. VVAC002]|uniref:hypothetical protein n=1 Tax=Microbulbifer sp. VVAC002 TaxID=3243387 RepID=UPI0040390AD0